MFLWPRDVVVITAAQFHSTKPELKFCAGSNPPHAVPGNLVCMYLLCMSLLLMLFLWQWSWLEIGLSDIRRSVIPQNQFIIIITTYDLKAINAIYSLILFYMSFVFHSHVLESLSYVICMSFARTRISSVCHSYVIRLWLACTRMSSVCHLYVLVFHPNVARMYLYVTRMSLVCTRISSTCHSSLLIALPK